jgi:hypothetical protein
LIGTSEETGGHHIPSRRPEKKSRVYCNILLEMTLSSTSDPLYHVRGKKNTEGTHHKKDVSFF